MPMTFAAMVSAINATPTAEGQIRILVDYLRDNVITDVIDAAAIVNALPAADQDDSVTVYNDEGVLKVSTAP
jgi:cobalamin-dependent methionine synthase I